MAAQDRCKNKNSRLKLNIAITKYQRPTLAAHQPDCHQSSTNSSDLLVPALVVICARVWQMIQEWRGAKHCISRSQSRLTPTVVLFYPMLCCAVTNTIIVCCPTNMPTG